ncbi:MAG: porin [Sutterellaceae bacterium]|nr:porin [Sutterellaceae bacterium]
MRQSIKLALAAAAVSAAFGVQAAEVSLYGSISTGLVYSHGSELTSAAGNTSEANGPKSNSLSMESAWFGDSIWGITGEEELGNGWTVGFTLENEFASDSGALGTDGKIFDSQAYLRVGNDMVNFAFGNIGGLASAGGDFDMIGGFDPMGAFFDVGGMGAFATRDYASDNMIVAEVTPMEGLKVSLMGSVGDQDSQAAWEDRTHYYALGASYEVGSLAVAGVVEMLNYDSRRNTQATKDDNGYTFTLGVSYDFGVVKPSFVYQHADKLRSFQGGDFYDDTVDPETYNGSYKFESLLLGATAPIADGTLMASVQYVKGKSKLDSEEEGNATILAVAYSYELSKRTSLWTGATYAVGGDGLDKDLGTTKEFGGMERGAYNGYTFGLGLVHTF